MKKTAKDKTAAPPLHVDGNVNFDEQVAHRAYELWEQRGGEHGNDMADWFRAEQEIKDWHHHHPLKT